MMPEGDKGPGVSFLADVQHAPRAAAAIGALAVLVLTYLVPTVWYWYRLSHVPGPFWAAFSKAWMVRESLRGRQPTAIKQATDKYGELMPRRAACTCPATRRHIDMPRAACAHWAQRAGDRRPRGPEANDGRSFCLYKGAM